MGKKFTSAVCLSLICSLVVLSLSIVYPNSCHSRTANTSRYQSFLQSLPMTRANVEQANSEHCLNRVMVSQARFSSLQKTNLHKANSLKANLHKANLQQKVSIDLGKESMTKNQLSDQSDCMGCCVPLSHTLESSTHQHHTFIIALKTGVKTVSLAQPKRPPKSTFPHLYTNNTVI